MAAGSTYTPIATLTGDGITTKSLTFSSIPSTYTDLKIVCNATVNGGSLLDGFFMRFNGDTATNYSTTAIVGTGSAASSSRTTSSATMSIGTVSGSEMVNTLIDVQNYSNTSTYKTALIRNNNAGFATYAYAGLWRSTAAINSITLFHTNGGAYYFTSGSTFTLYGIAAA